VWQVRRALDEGAPKVMILHVEPRMGTPGKCVVLECPEMQEDPATRFGGWFCRAHNEALAQTQKEALAARSMDRDQLEASYMWGNISAYQRNRGRGAVARPQGGKPFGDLQRHCHRDVCARAQDEGRAEMNCDTCGNDTNTLNVRWGPNGRLDLVCKGCAE